MAHEHEHDCSHLKEALGEYLDGEIDSELCRELREHLKDCRRCRVVVDSTRQTLRIFAQERPVELPRDVEHRLQERLKARLLLPGEP